MKNVILISLDTLRADVAYSGKFPTINKLRQRGVTFRNVVSSSPLTPISHATIFTGLQPYHHGIRHLFREKLRNGVPTIASCLQQHGYKTGAIVSCPGMNKWYRLNRGFMFYDDSIPLLPNGENPLHCIDVNMRGTALKRAPLVVEKALSWIQAQESNQKFFLFMHFFDSHWPYEPPEDVGVSINNPYEGEVAYMDFYLGEFFNQLESIGYDISDDLVILFSDHGEDLSGWYVNDHAGVERGHPEERGHGCLLFDATQMVPWIVNGPGINSREITQQVRLVDIAPTIFDILGIDYSNISLDGNSVVDLLSEAQNTNGMVRAAYCETYYLDELREIDKKFAHLSSLRGVRIDNRCKIIWKINGRDIAEIYDLLTDEHENNPQVI